MDFYGMPLSPPCRSVMLLAKTLGVKLNMKTVNLLKKEQLTPEYLALNPEHVVPTIVIEKDFVLWESRAIMGYLVAKYGKDDSLYPTDPKKRALVDRRLYFDATTLFPRIMKYVVPAIFNWSPLDKENEAKVHEVLGWLDNYLKETKFTALHTMTVADYSIIATLTQLDGLDMDISRHSHVVAWKARCKQQMVGYGTENEPGINHMREIIKSYGTESSR